MRLPCRGFCFEELLKLGLVVAHQVLLQLIDAVAVLGLNK